MERKTGRKLFALLISILLACGLCLTAYAEDAGESEFTIKGKTLVKYNGWGGEVTVPDGIEVLDEWAFSNSCVTKVNLPETLREIKDYCFFECEYLSEMTLPASLVRLGDMQAFAYTPQLEAINVAEGNPFFVSVDGVLFNTARTKLLYYPEGRDQGGEYAIPEGITALGGSALQHTGLTAIDIPSTLVKLYNGNDFSDNFQLKEIRVAENHPTFRSVNGMLFDRSGTLICYPAGLEKETLGAGDFPAEMKAIAPYAFQFAQHLKTVEIPDGIDSIEWMCFTFSPSLESVTLPASVASVSGYAFADCPSLEKVTILNPKASIMLDNENFSADYRKTMDFNIINDSPKAVLYGYENSTTQDYAAKRNDPFVSLGAAPEGIVGTAGTFSSFVPACQQ